MSKTAKIILAVLLVIAIAGGALLLANPSDKDTNVTPSSGTDTSTDTSNQEQEAVVTITYDGDGFTASANTLQSGASIRVVNQSSSELDLASDPHPTHTDNTELNIGDILAGEGKTFKLTAKGTWGYHNHLDASQRGEITVE